MSNYHNSIFWVETAKIRPNPYQPRREFDERALAELADSIRQYGVLQPLVVTRHETETLSGLSVDYELIAGERRLRASRLAGIPQVPVIIRAQNEDAKVKLELAIIENLQREDLNPIDRAIAFEKLGQEFGLSHAEIGKKMGKSREYVSNSLRLLQLPDDIRQALIEKRITEGHTRPLMMLSDKPAEQATLFRDLVIKKLSVRETERIARGIAMDKVRKSENIITPGIRNYEEELAQRLGTRVHIEPREQGGKIVIDYFSAEDLDIIINLVKSPSAAGFVSSTTPLHPAEKPPILDKNLHSDVSVQPIALSNTIVDNTPVDHDHEITVFHPELSVHTPAPLPQVFHTEIPVPDVLVDTEPETTTLVDDRSIDEVRHADDTDDQDYNFNFFTI